MADDHDLLKQLVQDLNTELVEMTSSDEYKSSRNYILMAHITTLVLSLELVSRNDDLTTRMMALGFGAKAAEFDREATLSRIDVRKSLLSLMKEMMKDPAGGASNG